MNEGEGPIKTRGMRLRVNKLLHVVSEGHKNYTLKNTGLKTPQFGLKMDKLSDWVVLTQRLV